MSAEQFSGYRELTGRINVDGMPTPCIRCGAMVPVNLRTVHDKWHNRFDALEKKEKKGE